MSVYSKVAKLRVNCSPEEMKLRGIVEDDNHTQNSQDGIDPTHGTGTKPTITTVREDGARRRDKRPEMGDKEILGPYQATKLTKIKRRLNADKIPTGLVALNLS